MRPCKRRFGALPQIGLCRWHRHRQGEAQAQGALPPRPGGLTPGVFTEEMKGSAGAARGFTRALPGQTGRGIGRCRRPWREHRG